MPKFSHFPIWTALAREPLFIRAKLMGACFPTFNLVSTRYKWSTPSSAARESVALSSCRDVAELGASK